MLAWYRRHKLFTFILVALLPIAYLVLSVVYFSGYLTVAINNTIKFEASDIAQCKTMPIGHKACGGPAAYIIYSTKTTDIDRYRLLVATRDVILAPANFVLSLVFEEGASDCSFVMPPPLELVDGKCVAGSSAVQHLKAFYQPINAY